MRLKRLLAVLLATVICTTLAAAAGAQLTNVSVVAQGNSTTVMMHATGTFGHNEYRANDGLLLVDLTGVSAGKMHERVRALQVPGVRSYRVVGYKGMGGVDIARLELRLQPGAAADVKDAPGGVAITVTPKDGAAAEAAGATTTASVQTPKPAPAEHEAEAPRTISQVLPGVAQVDRIEVSRGNEGMQVEVFANTAIQGKVMKLTGPDRLVLDIDNSVPAAKPRPIRVNAGGVKTVRMAQFQAAPPVTRVVVDLDASHDYDLVSEDNKLVLKLRPTTAAAEVKPAAEPSYAAEGAVVPVRANAAPAIKPAVLIEHTRVKAPKAKVEMAKLEKPSAAISPVQETAKVGNGDSEPSTAAQPVVFVEPKYQAKAEGQQDVAPAAQAPVPPVQAPVAAPTVEAAPQQPATPANRTAAPSSGKAVNFAREQRESGAQELAQKPQYTGEPISVNLKDVDLKDFFRLIHEISGLNIVLDPEVHGSLTLVLDNVPWDQALDIVLKNNGLDRQLEGNVLRIATMDSLRKEAEAQRMKAEAQALAADKVNVTRFLSYAHAKDVMPTVKKLLSKRGDIVADERTNALIIQDIPSVIPEVDRLLVQLDRKTQEVEIEARVVAATRQFARDIGSQLGFGWGNGPTAVGGVGAVGSSPIGGSVPNPKYFLTPGAKLASIPLFTNLIPTSPTSGISMINETSNYRLDAILAAAESRGLLKILSRPRIVTQNNTMAVVKQGYRIPIVTLGQLGGPPSVTYIEAVLRLTVTPQITVENTIFLNVDIENTTPDFSQQVMGNPVFMTQQATTQVLVTDGGTVMIGGVIETQNSVTVNQVPWLGDVPVLGELFKHRQVKNSTQELIFIITPKIIQT